MKDIKLETLFDQDYDNIMQKSPSALDFGHFKLKIRIILTELSSV
jgi:hypothetical protein